MLRNPAAALALLLVSQTVFGLGLGTLKQSSALNEPFDGRVEILGANARDADTITVKLADEAQFERAGVLREAVLLQLRFTVVDEGAKDYIQISSREPIREPFLNFLLELNWANGRVVREYTVLLDPPLYDPSPRRPSTQTVAAATPAAPVPQPTASSTSAPATSAAAPSVRPAAPMAAPGSTLGVVAANDTLWSLASNNRPDASISVQQMMLALLRANPEAFGDGNINILKRGAVLRMPDSNELTALSRSEALAEVQRQHQIWNGYRDTVTEAVAEAPLTGSDDMSAESMSEETPASTDAPTPADEVTADAADDARLELVAPGSDDDQMGAGDGDTGSADVTLTREELDAQVQANSELQARIAEADEIIDLMRRQVDIKDDELAALQARLAELGIDAPADLTIGTDDESVDEEMMSEEADAFATEEDEAEVAPEVIDEVDISIGDSDDSGLEDDAEIAGMDEDAGDDIAMDDGGGDTATGSLLGGLIPAHITNMVPGGAMTILGVIGVLVLALVAGLVKLLGGRREDEAAPAVGVATEADDVTALTEIADDDEPITETRELDATVVIDPDTVEADAYDGDVPPELQATSPDLQATIESSAEELAQGAPAAEPEDDPLEEVNVYLAYERFDQAEELVRKVIADHPDDHKYKLRLLEVYYSSNDKVAYETAAGELRDAVGENDPLWESAVAMWAEMSPDRALFEEGADTDVAADPAADSGRGFVDITADADDAGAKTMSMAPGTDSVLESTQVGLTPLEGEDDEGGLDFDLGAEADGEDDGGMLDLTGGMEESADRAEADAEDDGGMLDLTGGMEESADDAVFDLTAAADTTEALDFSLDGDAPDSGSDTSDLAAADADLLDVTTPELGDGHDLLDVTKTGELVSGESEDILNVTSPGLMSGDEPDTDDDILDISGDGTTVDFDISDTVAPAFDEQEEDAEETENDVVFDITSDTDASTADGDVDELDFDIGSLGDNDVTAEFEPSLDDAGTLDITGGSDTLDITGGTDTLDITGGTEAEIEADAREMLEDSLDLDIPDAEDDSIDTVEMAALPLEDTRNEADLDDALADTDTVPLEVRAEAGAAADFDLSLQGSELDELSIGADTVGGDGAASDDEESEIEFDLALQDTTEMDSLVIDDTLELPKSREPDETLDDLTKSMEESMAELDIDDDELVLDDDDGELDLSLADTTNSLDLELGSSDELDDDVPSLDFDINDLDIEDLDQADTVAMDLSSTTSPASEETVVMPVDDSVERQSEADEIDTKLNLAKAYIELGDNDGARSILDEVARDGSDAQQTEAQRLINQLT